MISRTSIVMGPAVVTWNGGTYYTKGDIIVRPMVEMFDVITSQFGATGKRIKQRAVQIQFTPCGEWEADTKTKLFPFASTKPGDTIAQGSDLELLVTPDNGTRPISFKNTFLTGMPELIFGATETMIGPVTFMAIGLDDTEWSVANSLYEVEIDGVPSFATFDDAGIITRGHILHWTPAALTTFQDKDSETPIRVSFNMQAKAFEIDSVGIIDYRFQRLDISITAQPTGMTETEYLAAMVALQGTGAKRGGSATSQSGPFLIKEAEGGTTVATFPNMVLSEPALQYSSENQRFGPTTWTNYRTISAGVLVAAFTFA